MGQTRTHRFIIMEWIDGLPLDQAWDGLETPQRLRLFLKVLQAVGAAYASGVTHRDIKPSNISVTVSLSPKILDFGIAVQDHHGDAPEEGLFKGTPGYCAPEQVTPPVKVSHATDVYALGVLLYQLLTGRLPFEQSDLKTLFEAIRSAIPSHPAHRSNTSRPPCRISVSRRWRKIPKFAMPMPSNCTRNYSAI